MRTESPKVKIRIELGGKLISDSEYSSFPLVFGRSPQCHIALSKFEFLSRNHGSINLDGDSLTVTDLGSTNGIQFQNERRNNFKLGHQGSFKVGDMVFKLSIQGSDSESTVVDKNAKKSFDPEKTIVVAKESSKLTGIAAETKARAGAGVSRQNLTRTKQLSEIQSKSPLTPLAVPNSTSTQVPVDKAVIPSTPVTTPEVKPSLPSFEIQQAKVFHAEARAPRKFELQPDTDIIGASIEDISLQGVITWGEEIYDVRNFVFGDQILLGPNDYEPIFLPTLSSEVNFGKYTAKGAILLLPNDREWSVHREGVLVSKDLGLASGDFKETNGKVKLTLAMNEVCEIDMQYGLRLHLRYVRVPRPLVKRTMIENREEFQKAITISIGFHIVFSILSLLSAPKDTAPKVENVPPRFAKLLVQPPQQLLVQATPTPTPIPTATPEPTPEPKKEAEKPKPTPTPVPKPTPAPKPIVKKEKPKPTPVPVAKATPAPQPVSKPQPLPVEKPQPQPVAKPEPKVDVKPVPQAVTKNPAPVAAPKPEAKPIPTVDPQIAIRAAEKAAEAAKEAAEKKEAEAMANMFATLPAAGQKGPAQNIKIDKAATGKAGTGAVGVGGLVGNLKAQQGDGNLGLSGQEGNNLGAAAAKAGYQSGGVQGKAGKREVVGAVVGTPSFKGGANNGLTNEQVMAVVNKYLSSIHQCYERALFADAGLSGRVEYEWEISASGDVTSVSVKRSEVSRGDALNNCVMDVFKKMKFPNGKAGQSTTANIGFPFGRN